MGIVTFDTAIHFYSFNADRTGHQMLLVPDGENPFPPAATSSLVAPLSTAMNVVSCVMPLTVHWCTSVNVYVPACMGGSAVCLSPAATSILTAHIAACPLSMPQYAQACLMASVIATMEH